MKRKKKAPTRKELLALAEALRAYCRLERRSADVGSPEMVERWLDLCRRVGVNPNPRWGR